MGFQHQSTVEIEQARVEAHHAKLEALRRDVVPFEPYERVIEGTVFEVVWNGSVK